MKHALEATVSSAADAKISRRTVGTIALAGAGLSLATFTAVNATPGAGELLGLMNAFRAQNGVGALSHSAALAGAMQPEAQRQMNSMSISHSTTFLTTPAAAGNTFAREIIALSVNGSMSELLDFWKSSPAHRAALLAPEANVCGIGLAYGSGGWKIVGNVGIYRFENGAGSGDSQAQQSTVAPQSNNTAVVEQPATTSAQPQQTAEAQPAPAATTQAEAARVEVATAPKAPEVRGGIAARYHAEGGESVLGLPLGDEQAINGGVSQSFTNANGGTTTILWTEGKGAFAINESGAIGQAWRAHGGESGIGFPTSEEHRFGMYVLQNFDSGKVLARHTMTGEVSVH